MMDDKLSFKEHINATSRKAYQILGLIFRCGKFFKNPGSMVVLYNSLVRSRLEYCSTMTSSRGFNVNLLGCIIINSDWINLISVGLNMLLGEILFI